MGTRGLLFVRCCGRYFVYYNHWDSYPEGLGDAIVEIIPEDPEKYREWLESMRERFSKLARLYEEKCLPVDTQKRTLAERCATSFLAVDDRLQEPPAQIRISVINQLFMEWTYTLDLDRELFGIDNSVYYKMSKVPHDVRWIKYLHIDEHGRRVLRDSTPMDIIGSVNWFPQVSSASKDRFDKLDIQTVDASILAPSGPKTFSHRIDALSGIFQITHNAYWGLLDEYLFEWNPEDFCFREIAFALLSLAAGEITFESPGSLDRNYLREGYFLIPDSKLQEGQQQLLPELLYECHAPGVEPGSAPRSTSYWFGNVLVYLAPRLDLISVEETSIAEAVDTGLDQGLSSFCAVVFSIMDFILVRVETNDGHVKVQKSPLLNLFYFDDNSSRFVNGARSRLPLDLPCGDVSSLTVGSGVNEQSLPHSPVDSVHDSDNDPLQHEQQEQQEQQEQNDEDEDDREAATKQKTPLQKDFKLLVQFFNAAANDDLVGKNSQTLPNEILGSIMGFTDVHTYKTMAKVSSYCGKMDLEKLRLNDDYAVVDFDDKQTPYGYILEDVRTGQKIPTKMASQNPDFETQEGMALSPVVGNSTRRSIIASVCVHFTNATPNSENFTEKVEMPEQEHFFSTGGFYEEGVEERVFNMPKDVYPGGIEKAWGDYITYLIHKGQDSMYCMALINRAKWECLLPPGYRELRMEHFYCNGLHAFLRHPDDETPQEWEHTVRHAVTELNAAEKARAGLRFTVRGRPVIIAFGTKVKFFYYVHRCDEVPAIPETASSHSLEIAARCVEPDPGRRLVQLIPGDNSIDIRESENRAKLEDWIQIFRGTDNINTEWDPFTGERKPYGKAKQEESADVQDEGEEDGEQSLGTEYDG